MLADLASYGGGPAAAFHRFPFFPKRIAPETHLHWLYVGPKDWKVNFIGRIIAKCGDFSQIGYADNVESALEIAIYASLAFLPGCRLRCVDCRGGVAFGHTDPTAINRVTQIGPAW